VTSPWEQSNELGQFEMDDFEEIPPHICNCLCTAEIQHYDSSCFGDFDNNSIPPNNTSNDMVAEASSDERGIALLSPIIEQSLPPPIPGKVQILQNLTLISKLR
jgi:hypothetical protein